MTDRIAAPFFRLIPLAVAATLSVEARASDSASNKPSGSLVLSPSFFTDDLIENLNIPSYMKSRTDLFEKWYPRFYKQDDGRSLDTGEIDMTASSRVHLEYVYRNDEFRSRFGGKLVATLMLCSSTIPDSIDYKQTLEGLRHQYPQVGEPGNVFGETLKISQRDDTDFLITHFGGFPDYVQCLGIVSYTERSP